MLNHLVVADNNSVRIQKFIIRFMNFNQITIHLSVLRFRVLTKKKKKIFLKLLINVCLVNLPHSCLSNNVSIIYFLLYI